jgi:adenylate cyclase
VGPRDSLQSSVLEGRKDGLRGALVLLWVIVALAALPATRHLSLFEIPQHWAYDQALQRRPPRPPADVVIVGIDETSIRHLGRFPWPRVWYARLLARLAQARAVGLDIILAEPERPGERLSPSDAALAKALREHGRVVLPIHVVANPEVTAQPRPLRQFALPIADLPLIPWRVHSVQLTPPLPAFAAAAAGVGFVDIHPDADGIYRRANLLLADEDHVYPHFALELARVAQGLSRAALASSLRARRLQVGDTPIPLDRRGQALIDYCGPHGTIPTVRFCDVVEGRVPADRLAGKVVVVGATAPGLYDIRPAPFAQQTHFFLGVEINASLCSMLLHGPGLRDASSSLGWLVGGGVLGSGCLVATWLVGEAWVALVLGLGVLCVQPLAFFLAFWVGHTVLPLGGSLVATALGWLWSGYRRLGLERNVIRHHFATYVSPEVLAELMRHPHLLREGQWREITLLFSDIRGSTTLAESIQPPERWLAQLNEYLTAMSEIILTHHGYLDKFMGDGIMAVWNAFGNQPQHRDLAVQAALSMLRGLEELNAAWRARGEYAPVRVGIGVHTGPAIVGNVGSQHRTQFTALGDTVNAAARIEQATKDFRVPLAISEATCQGLSRDYGLVELGTVQLRGRKAPTRLYTIQAALGGAEHVVAPPAAQATDRGAVVGPDPS